MKVYRLVIMSQPNFNSRTLILLFLSYLAICWIPLALGGTEEPLLCSHQCTCRGIDVNCSTKGMTLPPNGLSSGYHYFEFENIDLRMIDDEDFSQFTSMLSLSLSQNMITTISEDAFFHNKLLKRLDLSRNKLEYLPDNLFVENVELESLYLSRNRLLQINASTFENLINLQILRMNDNHLKYIDQNAFINLHKLQELYLEDNYLVTPYKQWLKSFDHLDGPYEVYLDNNQWSCDCNMKPFMHWYRSQKWYRTPSGISRVAIPYCHEPEIYKRMSIEDMDESAFICESMVVADIEQNVVLENGEYTIWCNASGVPVPTVTITKNGKELNVSHEGKTHVIIKPVSSSSGEYICKAEGGTSHGQPVSQSSIIKVVVHTKQNTAVIVIGLILVLVACGAAVWFYKTKYSKNSKYTTLPSNNMHYNAEEEEMLNGQDSSPMMNGQLQTSNDQTSDDEVNFSTNEKEVLV